MTAEPDCNSWNVQRLANLYGPALRAYFSRRTADRAEVDDLTQDVFLSLLRRGQLDTIENVEGYLFSIAANLLRQRARATGRRPDLLEGFADAQSRLIDDLSCAPLWQQEQSFAIEKPISVDRRFGHPYLSL